MPKLKRCGGLHRSRTRAKRSTVANAENEEIVMEPGSPEVNLGVAQNEENVTGSPVIVGPVKSPRKPPTPVHTPSRRIDDATQPGSPMTVGPVKSPRKPPTPVHTPSRRIDDATQPGSPMTVGPVKTPRKPPTPVHTPSKLLAAHVLAFELPAVKVPTPVKEVQVPSPTIMSHDSPPSEISHGIQITPSKLASKFVVLETKRVPTKNLTDYFRNFAPSAENSPVSTCPQRRPLFEIQPSTSVTSVKVTPQKLGPKFTVSSLPDAPRVNGKLASFFSNFVPSPIKDVAMVTPSKLGQNASVCASDNIFLSDDILPLDWNQDFQSEHDQEGNISVVTHNTRRKLHKVSSNSSAQDIEPVHEQETTEDDVVSQMMGRVSLQHASPMDSSPTKSHNSNATADHDFSLISEDGYGSEGANFDSESEWEEVEEEEIPQRNPGPKFVKSPKVCTCKCRCGAPPASKESKGRPVSYEFVMKKPEKEFHRLTGLSKHNFLVVYNFVGGDDMFNQLKYQYNPNTPNKRKKKQRPDRLTHYDRLLLTLMRLRRGFSTEDLALFFDVSSTLISDIFFAVVQLMNLHFQPLREHMFTTRAAQPTSVRPACLKPFKNFRATIDTTEVKIQVPYHYKQQGNTHSSYKGANVVNYLVACNCWGAVSFISPGFEGSISDIELFKVSGICDYLHPDDVLLVDRGFTIEEHTDPLRVKVVRPAFKGDRIVFSPEEDLLNRKISAGRIHIERCIRKLKCFHILKRITNNMLPNLDHIVFVIACLVNFDPPIIQSFLEDEN